MILGIIMHKKDFIMKHSKNIAFLLVSCILLFSFVSCGKAKKDPSPAVSGTEIETPAQSPTPPIDPAAEYLKTDKSNTFELTGVNKPYYVGRWFEKEIDGISHMVTLNDGSIIYFMVKDAESFTLDFTVITGTDIPYFSYSIDGSTPVRQKVDNGTVNLPDTDYHIIRIITDGLTESVGKWDYERGFALKSLTVSEGGQLIGIKPTDKVIFFYGDSITEGISALGPGWNTEVNSATNAYSWHCAKNLHTVPYIVGYGGSGLIKTGSFNTMENAVQYYSKNRPVNDGFMPDLIVINHGHNDGDVSSATFKTALMKVIQLLSNTYPDTPIVYVVPFNQAHAATITETLTPIGGNIHVITTAGWGIETTDGAHPSAAGAILAGSKLSNELIKLLGKDFFNL